MTPLTASFIDLDLGLVLLVPSKFTEAESPGTCWLNLSFPCWNSFEDLTFGSFNVGVGLDSLRLGGWPSSDGSLDEFTDFEDESFRMSSNVAVRGTKYNRFKGGQ